MKIQNYIDIVGGLCSVNQTTVFPCKILINF